MRYAGKLEGKNQKSEIGSVIPAHQVRHRMRTGKYNFVYPGYDKNSIQTYVPNEEGEKIRAALQKELEKNKKK